MHYSADVTRIGKLSFENGQGAGFDFGDERELIRP
jgi:hypothetical protein